MKRLLTAATLVACLVAPAWAKNLAVPTSNPAATITIPDSWSIEESTYGYDAKSPDGDVFFGIEFADEARMPKMMANNEAWMKRNKIVPTAKAEEQTFKLGGLDANLVAFPAQDENGETRVEFVFIPAGNRVIMLTLWASEEEQKANDADLTAIKRSIKAIN